MGSTANEDVNGEFRRRESSFRHWVTADGRTGLSGVSGFAAESGRYHLYVSLACPWAHRTLIMRVRKGLAPHIGVSVVHCCWTRAVGVSSKRRASFRSDHETRAVVGYLSRGCQGLCGALHGPPVGQARSNDRQ